MAEDQCRMIGCDNPTRDDGGAYSRKFCSTRCELKYDHIRADAEDAMRADIEEHGSAQGPY